MTVRELALGQIGEFFGNILEVLYVEKCYGFSTDDLGVMSRSCKKLGLLSIAGSIVEDLDLDWFRYLTQHKCPKVLNVLRTEIELSANLLELVAVNWHLEAVKVECCDINGLGGFFRTATKLKKFYGLFFQQGEEVIVPEILATHLEMKRMSKCILAIYEFEET